MQVSTYMYCSFGAIPQITWCKHSFWFWSRHLSHPTRNSSEPRRSNIGCINLFRKWIFDWYMGLAILFILDNRFLIIILRSFIFKTCVVLRRELIRVVEDKRSIRVITHKHKFVANFFSWWKGQQDTCNISWQFGNPITSGCVTLSNDLREN